MAVICLSKIRGCMGSPLLGEGTNPIPQCTKDKVSVLTRRPCWAFLSCLAPVTFGAWGAYRPWWSRLPRRPWRENEKKPENTVG